MNTDVDFDSLRRQSVDFSRWSRAGAVALGLFAAVFGIWAVFAPIAGAVIAPGTVVSDGRTQTLRHATGGVVTEILVREGQRISAGEVVAVLDEAGRQADHTQIVVRLASLDVTLARLSAEQAGTTFAPTIEALREVFPGYGDALLAQLLADQQQEYGARRIAHATELEILGRQQGAIAADRAGLLGERAALALQIASLEEDIGLRRTALQDGYGRAAQLRQMEREHARIAGNLARADGQLKALDEQMAELDRRIAALEAARDREISEALAAARSERLELSGKATAAAGEVDRVKIRADAAGVVDRLHVNTIGSAVEPYAAIADIVPEDAPLLVEARVAIAQIDDVAVGQFARVQFEGIARQNIDPLPAEVVYVSPDSHLDERTNTRHYTVRLSVDRDILADLPATLPGMPVQTYFLSDEHTLVQFLIQPLADSFSRAFR